MWAGFGRVDLDRPGVLGELQRSWGGGKTVNPGWRLNLLEGGGEPPGVGGREEGGGGHGG